MREMHVQSYNTSPEILNFRFSLGEGWVADLGFYKNAGRRISEEKRAGSYSLWWSKKEMMSLDRMSALLRELVAAERPDAFERGPVSVEAEYLINDASDSKLFSFFLAPDAFVLDADDAATEAGHRDFITEYANAIEFATYSVKSPLCIHFLIQADIHMDPSDWAPEIIFVFEPPFFPTKLFAQFLQETSIGNVSQEEADAIMQQASA
ncbi:MAG: hypothetical protein U1A23_00810, partial [Candidatus Sungbacteria bacterium]|nr:hypothetical protein [Candidatus Sungbacteria bacterium]